jgi:hypothetical protein
MSNTADCVTDQSAIELSGIDLDGPRTASNQTGSLTALRATRIDSTRFTFASRVGFRGKKRAGA